MTRHSEDSNSTVKTRRQQEDQRRMAFRRAIEDRCQERQLLQSISDYRNFIGRHPWLPSETFSQRADLHTFAADKAQECMGHW